MCEVYDKLEGRGIKVGMERGMRTGIKAFIETCQENSAVPEKKHSGGFKRSFS